MSMLFCCCCARFVHHLREKIFELKLQSLPDGVVKGMISTLILNGAWFSSKTLNSFSEWLIIIHLKTINYACFSSWQLPGLGGALNRQRARVAANTGHPAIFILRKRTNKPIQKKTLQDTLGVGLAMWHVVVKYLQRFCSVLWSGAASTPLHVYRSWGLGLDQAGSENLLPISRFSSKLWKRMRVRIELRCCLQVDNRLGVFKGMEQD